MTKKYKRNYKLCKWLSVLITLVPLIVYAILGFVNGTIAQKISLGVCLITALVFTALNIILKYHIRCTIWILLIGIYACIENIIPLLFILAISTALDEFVLEPLAKKYKSLYVINKEIDKRGVDGKQGN